MSVQTEILCDAKAADVLRSNSRSFSVAAMFLPRRVRGKVQRLYAWCRTVDDAVDHAETPPAAERELDRLSEDLRRMMSESYTGVGELQHVASKWIAPLIREDGVDVAHAVDLVEGMKMDLRIDSGEFSIDTDAELLRYSYHAAGTVALMMTRLMGVADPAARPHAVALGVAMQLTNIARDVREDAERGRCYLPGIASVSEANRPVITDSVRHILNLAEDRYRVAEAGLQYLPADCRRAIRVALVAYREIGREVLRRDCNVLAGRTVVPKLRLLSVVSQAALPGIFLMSQTSDQASSVPADSHLISSINQSKSAVWLGLSLTAFMATALFVMVYMNPKSDAFSTLPLIYAAVSLTFAIIANRLAAKYERADQRKSEV